MKSKILLFLFLLPILAFACNGSAWIQVPAVVEDGSSLVNVSVRLVPGDSDVFLSTYPQTGTSTQLSVEDAAIYAFMKAGLKDCDAIVKLDTEGAGYVEGPSGGAAFTVVAYSAATGLEPRKDTVITGSVDALGYIGEVGGVYEKAMAAVASDADYFVMPRSSILDLLMLRNVKENYGLEIVEASDADALIDFMFYNKSLPSASFDRTPEEVPDVPPYDITGLEGFVGVARKMINAENRTVEGLPETGNESIAIKRYFSGLVDRQENILAKGYLFTAANDAFLNYIEISTISAVFEENVDLEEKKGEVQKCLSSLPLITKTVDNFEWAVGSDLRRSWALQMLNDTDTAKPKLLEERYFAYNDLMYSDAWCIVSTSLSEAAGASGTQINESRWKELAEQKLDEAWAIEDISLSSEDHIYSSELSFSEGKYGAAIYDAVYVIEMENAKIDLLDRSTEEIDDELDGMLNESRESLWGSVYQSQGAYLANTSSRDSAYNILRYAKGLDAVTAEMRSLAAPVKKAEPERSQHIFFLSIFLIITLLLFYITTWIDRRLHGPRIERRRKVS